MQVRLTRRVFFRERALVSLLGVDGQADDTLQGTTGRASDHARRCARGQWPARARQTPAGRFSRGGVPLRSCRPVVGVRFAGSSRMINFSWLIGALAVVGCGMNPSPPALRRPATALACPPELLRRPRGPIRGMFLVVKNPSNGCAFHRTLDGWRAEFSAMQRIGVAYIVLQNTVDRPHDGQRLYPDPTGASPFAVSTCAGGETQVPHLLRAAAELGMSVWLGGIWNKTANDAAFSDNIRDLVDPLRGNAFDRQPAFAGLYLSHEQTLTPQMAHQPYIDMISTIRQLGYTGPVSVSPSFYHSDYPLQPATPPGCDGSQPGAANLYRRRTITLQEAKPSMERLLARAPRLAKVMVQDKLGREYVGLFNVSNFFGLPYGFGAAANLRSGQLVWNLEAFDLAGDDCFRIGSVTASWHKVARALSEASEAGVGEVVSYEWMTNWSPVGRFAQTRPARNYAAYLERYVGETPSCDD